MICFILCLFVDLPVIGWGGGEGGPISVSLRYC